ncbi:isoprenylcysteine carboxylmethyltransferase family protein [Variovorax sp. J22R133]|uniref:methyltransferase family protein n=1 Tax=Variovorax brevis TaxID=3053503 RepID=UPI0025779409|nr:isoprenylcysteine carboxylmethyltransferase family protein [Variovorax sp. J22R133]MDM0115092.1 isoprenylcysteine carboxylmethyltransferase family protein [Variovorax sp. J22R133]
MAWAVYWWLMSGNVKATAKRESLSSRLTHVVPLGIAVLLVWAPGVQIAWLDAPIAPRSPWLFLTGTVLVTAGLLFTVWARRHLGRNWSAIVTVKQDHELICTGPYAIVRHPIYTGLLLAFVGSAVAVDEWRGALAVLIAALALWRKLRLEERWMREQFGDKYVAYSKKVPALVPFIL